MEVINRINIYEQDGEDTSSENWPTLTIKSHQIYAGRVVLEFQGHEITVVGNDLRRAIDNACNVRIQ